MARDYPIRGDLQKIGLPERTIRVLEKVALLIQALEDIDANAGAINDLDDATTALEELIEDAELTLETLDDRLDDLEDPSGPHVKKAGDTMSGALNVNALLECDTFRLNVAPVVAAAVASTHTVDVNINGAAYKILLSNV
jgi:hypothetical protein